MDLPSFLGTPAAAAAATTNTTAAATAPAPEVFIHPEPTKKA
jgi:hypothetical protein